VYPRLLSTSLLSKISTGLKRIRQGIHIQTYQRALRLHHVPKGFNPTSGPRGRARKQQDVPVSRRVQDVVEKAVVLIPPANAIVVKMINRVGDVKKVFSELARQIFVRLSPKAIAGISSVRTTIMLV
jgi:hypothetical protein